ncbi:MAG: dual specificity protein phosphatase family protein [Candidatus Sericytochromatia bacterium]
MHEIFWIEPERLGGRCGPDTADWDLNALKAEGIGAVLSVNQGTLCNPQAFASAGITWRCLPLSEHAPPQPGDFEHNLQTLPLAYDFLCQQLGQGHKVIVHCRSGKDRTGLLLAYWLVRNTGLPVEAAIARLMAVRPIALSAPGWREFAPEVLGASLGLRDRRPPFAAD